MPHGNTLKIRRWVVSVDVEAKRAIYAQRPGIACSCPACVCYESVRAAAIPKEVLGYLEAMGIDPRNEEELFFEGRAGGFHRYAGWYHAVGHMVSEEDEGPEEEVGDHFRFRVSGQPELPMSSGFEEDHVVCFSFEVQIPDDTPGMRRLREGYSEELEVTE